MVDFGGKSNLIDLETYKILELDLVSKNQRKIFY